MIVSAKTIAINQSGGMQLLGIPLDTIGVRFPCLLSIDGSTSTTGMGILRLSDGALVASLSFTREKDNETPVQYKVRMKQAVYKLLISNPLIQKVFYEEPFVGYSTAAPNLFMLRTFVEELTVEYEEQLRHITITEIGNQKWKRLFLAPDKIHGDTETQKKLVRDKLLKYMPFLEPITQDEVDAIAMGFSAAVKMREGLEDELSSKKKVHPFGYNIQFIGSDDDDVMVQELYDCYTGPKSLLSNGIAMVNLTNKGNFDKQIYEAMGPEDKIVIGKFKSSCYGNIVLEHKIGYLTQQFTHIYAIIWRKSRK